MFRFLRSKLKFVLMAAIAIGGLSIAAQPASAGWGVSFNFGGGGGGYRGGYGRSSGVAVQFGQPYGYYSSRGYHSHGYHYHRPQYRSGYRYGYYR